tara:strand:- start:1455 stop:2723 length:1269 start_codon:yes stop_codon:yes gene_type:complete
MLQRFKTKSEFGKNVLTLMTGTTIAQAIPVAISPILTRIYTPDDFGVFALFMAITAIFGSISTGRYDLAIMLPKKDEDAINIFALGFIITSSISFVLLVVVFIFQEYFVFFLKNEEIGVWLYLVPVSVFFIGTFNILSYFNIRKKNYKSIANVTILKSIVVTVIQLSIGFLKQGVTGLISGQIISGFFGNVKLLKNIIRDKILISKISRARIMALAIRYKDFPKFTLWTTLASALSTNITNILISFFYSVSTLGFYSLVQKVLAMPASLIGSSVGQVFFQQATKEKQKTGITIKSFNSTLKKLIIIGLPSFGILFFIVEDLFVIVFSEEWKIAGTYAKIALPLYSIRFVSSTLSSINIVFEKHKIGLYINIIVLISLLIIFISVKIFFIKFDLFLYIMTYVLFLEYFLVLIYYKKLSQGDFN